MFYPVSYYIITILHSIEHFSILFLFRGVGVDLINENNKVLPYVGQV